MGGTRLEFFQEQQGDSVDLDGLIEGLGRWKCPSRGYRKKKKKTIVESKVQRISCCEEDGSLARTECRI